MIKCIVLDMDGTVLTSVQEISELTKWNLIKVQEAGMRIILASGRNRTSLLHFAQQLKMSEHNGFLIASNGNIIVRVADEATEVMASCSQDQQRQVFKYAKEKGFEYLSVRDHEIYHYLPPVLVLKKHQFMDDKQLDESISSVAGDLSVINDLRKHYASIVTIRDEADLIGKANKICLCSVVEHIDKFESEIREFFGQKFNIFKIGESWFEFNPLGIDKGTTLLKVLSRLNIEPSETMILGDSENDLSMLSLSQHSVAMGNAMQSVKDQCNHQTLDNDNEGVSYALDRFSRLGLMFDMKIELDIDSIKVRKP